jgi:dipeptidyl aminopeptidase/acylaminoacyl peptidase
MKRWFILFILVVLTPLSAQKKVLDHDAYEIWQLVKEKEISPDGNWVLYVAGPENGDDQLVIKKADGTTTYQFVRAQKADFTYDSKYVIALRKPARETVRAAKIAGKKGDDLPADSLLIISLTSGEQRLIPNVKQYKLPEKNGDFVAYQLNNKTTVADSAASDSSNDGKEKSDKSAKPKKRDGKPLVLQRLDDGKIWQYDNVAEFVFSKTGNALGFSTSSADSAADGVSVVITASGETVTLFRSPGDYKQLAFDETGSQFAFVSNHLHVKEKQPAFGLYLWQFDEKNPVLLAEGKESAIPEGWWVSEHGDVWFSENGKRLFFGTAPIPHPKIDEKIPDDEKINVQVWHWKDPDLMTVQLKNVEKDKKRSYLAMVEIAKKSIVQLADTTVPEVELAAKGNADVAIGRSDLPYRQEISWDYPGYYDVYWIDLKKNRRTLVQEKLQYPAQISPNGKFAYWWQRADSAWYVYDGKSGKIRNLTNGIPVAFYYEKHDWPFLPESYGSAGWTRDDRNLLLYDRFDIWMVDPLGKTAPVNLTDGFGRQNNLRLRYLKLDDEQQTIDPDAPMLLSAFSETDKSEGFYRERIQPAMSPEKLLLMPKNFSRPQKAKLADRLIYTRESFQEFPDIWVSDLAFQAPRKLSELNPQQADYLWGTAELFEWHSLDGIPLQGLLYKPENFDATQKYPLMVYFYEKNSDNLHRHYPPIPHRSIINFSFYASRGYVIFVPDIVYQNGYPGESALKCVLPGVTKLIEKGFVDEKNIGVQGHSWGGYQIAYLVTRTNIFKAAEAGAPVSNMFSAYGGIRWETGLSRMFQYERTQSRIGGSIWEYPLRYVENSPVFWADKINTPLLIMHNDNDGHVPWYQGIELFVALRRLGKPAWLINYSGEPHWPTTYYKKRDWQIRLQQYFDHFLKGAPAPQWLEKGMPAIELEWNDGLGIEERKGDE